MNYFIGTILIQLPVLEAKILKLIYNKDNLIILTTSKLGIYIKKSK